MQKILIADDIGANIRLLGEMLKGTYDVIVANTGARAVQLALERVPDLILMDVMMPELDGFAACRSIRAEERTADIPIIFITAKTDQEDIISGFDAGGVDYVTKPFNPTELHARIRTHLELKRSREELKKYSHDLQRLNDELNHKNSMLSQALEQITLVSQTDHLTGLWNRNYMMQACREEEARFIRYKRDFSFVLCDIDYFKKINDTYGHECGDHALKMVASVLRNSVRQQDTAARWGGEEFLVLLPETDLKGAMVTAGRIRENVAAASLTYNEAILSMTMTLGVSVFTREDGLDATIRKADSALYQGKADGRNRVVSG